VIDVSLRVAAHLVRRTQQVHDAIFAERIGDLTSAQFAALVIINKYPDAEFMRLADALGYDSATLGGLVNRLIVKKLVRRRVGKHDRRTRLISMTARGKALLDETMPKALDVEAELLSALAADERELLIAMLERIVEGRSQREELILGQIA
jgi:DNA-binding MarR family transcriptional regulator